jgi:hypothetical protein
MVAVLFDRPLYVSVRQSTLVDLTALIARPVIKHRGRTGEFRFPIASARRAFVESNHTGDRSGHGVCWRAEARGIVNRIETAALLAATKPLRGYTR